MEKVQRACAHYQVNIIESGRGAVCNIYLYVVICFMEVKPVPTATEMSMIRWMCGAEGYSCEEL